MLILKNKQQKCWCKKKNNRNGRVKEQQKCWFKKTKQKNRNAGLNKNKKNRNANLKKEQKYWWLDKVLNFRYWALSSNGTKQL